MALLGIFEIILAAICFSIGCWLSNRYERVWNWPVVGMLPSLLTNIDQFHDWCMDIVEKSNGTYLFKGPWFCNMDMLGTCDPANVKHIMSSNFYNYPKGHEYKEMFDIFGDGIFNADADLWKYQRKIASALINHDRFRLFLIKTTYDKLHNGLIPVLEHVSKHGRIVDIQDLIHRFTLDVAMILVTGFDPKCLCVELPKDEVAIGLDLAEEAIFYRHVRPKLFWKLQSWLNFGQEKKIKEGKIMLDRIAAEYISNKREQLKDKSITLPEDLLASYISQGKNVGSKSEDEFLRDTILNFLVAGRENSLAWFFWLISKNPHVEAKIREELKSIASSANKTKTGLQSFDHEEVKKLIHLHAALCETLRLYPPVMYEHKEPLKPDVLPSGHEVDPKQKILLSTYVMGRLKMVWGEDCSEFKPERWISEEGRIIQQSPYKFLSFNAGPRTCLGKEIAFTEMKAIAAVIIHNYHVQVIEEHIVEPNVASIILHIKNGLMVRISRK